MYWNTSVLIIVDSKIRKNLGIPPREKTRDLKLPQLDKKAIQQKVIYLVKWKYLLRYE